MQFNLNQRGKKWLSKAVRIARFVKSMTKIPNRFWGVYGDGMPDGVQGGNRT
jgi:hypothetical protein